MGRFVVWGCFLVCVIGQAGGVKRLADYAAADYPPPWHRYYQAGQWLKANAPQDAIVLCRKGYWMYIVSGRRCVGFPFDEPAKVLAHIEREKVDYVVLESLGFPQTGQYLVSGYRGVPRPLQSAVARPVRADVCAAFSHAIGHVPLSISRIF